MILTCAHCARANRVPASRLLQGPVCGQCKAKLAPPDHPIAVQTVAEFDELTAGALPAVVDFWAAWCGPCRMVAPEVERLARAEAGRALVLKVDTEALPALAQRYAVHSIPTLALFRDGREERRLSGARSAAQIAQGLGL